MPDAFEPVVSQSSFDRAQEILNLRTIRRSDDELLQRLRDLWTKEGRLSHKLIQSSPLTPSYGAYRSRFGCLKTAYMRIGYGKPEDFAPIDLRSRIAAIRHKLINEIVALYPKEICKFQPNGRARAILRLASTVWFSVIVARTFLSDTGVLRWDVRPGRGESQNITLLARMDRSNESIQDMRVFQHIHRPDRFVVREEDKWLGQGLILRSLDALGTIMPRLS